MILYLDPYCKDGCVHITKRCLTTRYLNCGTAEGLYDAFGKVLKHIGPEESKA